MKNIYNVIQDREIEYLALQKMRIKMDFRNLFLSRLRYQENEVPSKEFAAKLSRRFY